MLDLEALLRAGAYQRVRVEATRRVREDQLATADQAWALRLACRASLHLQEYYGAARLGEQAVDLAREASQSTILGQALYDLGHAYLHIGDAAEATTVLQEFLAMASGVPSLEELEGRAAFNLAGAYRQRREWVSAIQYLERASTWFRQAGQPDRVARADLDLAWCYDMMGRTELAGPCIDRLEKYVQASESNELANDLVSARALHARVTGDLAASSRFAGELLHPGRPGVTDHHRAEACWLLAENAVDLGQLEEAGPLVDLAQEYAMRDNWPSLMNLAGDLRRRYQERVAAGV